MFACWWAFLPPYLLLFLFLGLCPVRCSQQIRCCIEGQQGCAVIVSRYKPQQDPLYDFEPCNLLCCVAVRSSMRLQRDTDCNNQRVESSSTSGIGQICGLSCHRVCHWKWTESIFVAVSHLVWMQPQVVAVLSSLTICHWAHLVSMLQSCLTCSYASIRLLFPSCSVS